MEVQAVQAHLWASVGVLSTPCGVDEHQAGVPRAGGVEQVDQGVAPLGVVGGPLFATAVVEVLIGALVEGLPHHCWPWVVIFRKGMVRPVVPVPGRRVWHRQAARVAVPQFDGTQCDENPRGGLQLDEGRPGALDGVVDPHSQCSQGPGYAIDLVAPRQGCELRDRTLHLGADAMHASGFPEHPGGLGAQGGRAVVDERAHEGHRRQLAPCPHPREPKGPVVL